MTDSNISALQYEIRSLNNTLGRLDEKVGGMDLRLRSIDSWLNIFWPKLLAIGAAFLVYGFLIFGMITHR
jgi:hypothetical protein